MYYLHFTILITEMSIKIDRLHVALLFARLKSCCRIFHHYLGVYFRVYGTFSNKYSELFCYTTISPYSQGNIFWFFFLTKIFANRIRGYNEMMVSCLDMCHTCESRNRNAGCCSVIKRLRIWNGTEESFANISLLLAF